MTVKLITDTTNGAKNIDSSRQETNRANLLEAISCWEEIINFDEKACPDYRNFNSANKYTKQQVTNTIPSRISKNFIHYGLDSPEEISWDHIKKMTKRYLEADEWLQINFCKDSTRQSLDELVQRKMLNNCFGDSKFKKCRPSKFVFNGKILDKNQYKALEESNLKTRKDIDTYGSFQERKFWIFNKYAKVAGGHQDNVTIETTQFLKDADEYVDHNSNNNIFIAQLDGKFIENLLPIFNDDIKNNSRVFAGNTEQVIDWIKNL